MQYVTAMRIYGLFALLLAAQWSADAGEIRQRSFATVGDGMVRLGDVAEVIGDSKAEREELAHTPLFPAPSDGKSRTLDRVELQQILVLSDVDIRTWRLVGSETTVVARRTLVQPTSHVAAPKASQASTLAPANVDSIAKTPSKSNPPVYVVAVHRGLARGEIVKQSDVELIPVTDERSARHALKNPEDVIGKETIRSISAGKPIEIGQVQAVRLVKRNEQVTIRAKAAGITVTISGKALEEGAAGDVISVEPNESRDRIAARVVGEGQVEVYAAGPQYPSGGTKQRTTQGAEKHD